MAKENTPLRYRLASTLLGRNKAFIPHLQNTLDAFDGGGNSVKNYRSKGEAITANLGWAFAANGAIVRPTAKVKLKLYRRDKKGDNEEIFAHPILDLLKRPNYALTGTQMRKLHFTYMDFAGESYELMMKGGDPFVPAKGQLPDALHVLPAHLCDFKLGDTYTQSTVKFDNVIYPITLIVRDLNPDPRNPTFGQSIVTAAAATIDTDEQMKDWNRRFFANNARPGLIFSTKEEMSDESYKRWNSPGVVGMIENANKSIMDGAIYIRTINNVLPRIEDWVELQNTSWIQIFTQH